MVATLPQARDKTTAVESDSSNHTVQYRQTSSVTVNTIGVRAVHESSMVDKKGGSKDKSMFTMSGALTRISIQSFS